MALKRCELSWHHAGGELCVYHNRCANILVLQSCLSKITLIRERELDKARKYFEMLYLSFDVSGLHVFPTPITHTHTHTRRLLRVCWNMEHCTLLVITVVP